MKPFLQLAAICSFLGAITTAFLIFMPNPEASSFEAQSQLFENRLYLSKLWTLFLHPQFNFIASLGVAFILFKEHKLLITIGLFFLFIWAFSEMSQQALLIDALNQFWRPGFTHAETEIDKNMFKTLIQAANGISDSKYFLVIYGFGLGSLLLGLAFVQAADWSKWIGIALIFIGILSLASFSRYYLGLGFLNGFADTAYKYVYPYLQPSVRIAMGIWILQNLQYSAKQ